MGMDGVGLSVADALALSRGNGNNDGGFGDGNGYWIFFLFFLLAWGNNGWGFGGNGGAGAMTGQALTRGELCQDMNFQSLENAVRGIQSGLCDGFYAMNTGMLNGFAGVQNTLCSGFAEIAAQGNNNTNAIQQSINAASLANIQGLNAMNIANMQNQNALQAQIAQCCCENREGQAQIRYDMAANTCALQNTMNNNTRDIIQTQEAGTRAILDYLCQDKISTLQTENQALRLAASQQSQTNDIISQLLPVARPAYITCSPYASAFGYTGYNGYGNYNNGCGCGCNN